MYYILETITVCINYFGYVRVFSNKPLNLLLLFLN